jgi:hypothetical protein
VDASLINIDTLPVWAGGVDDVEEVGAMLLEPPPPPPQAAVSAAMAPTNNSLDLLGTMMNVSSKLAINFPCHLLALKDASLCL